MPPGPFARSMSEECEVQNRLLEFLRGGMFSAETQVTAETDLIASGFDSLALVSLLVFVEKSYGLWIPQDEITEANLKNARSLAAVVVRLLNERQLRP
ncbi:MAG TPA: phosphopantetheine-binding protein [Verrucomicrobiae bacterium]|jgi:acyl carrier protein